jgi:hypothetical protein
VSDQNSAGETDSESAEKDASSADSTDRESTDGVPEYEGQWAALSDGESDGDSDGSSDSGAGDSVDK